MNYKKPNLFYYRLAQFVSWFVARICFQRKVLRNEIRDAKGPFVVLANHQAAYDFVNLIGLCKRPMHFVISNNVLFNRTECAQPDMKHKLSIAYALIFQPLK